MKRILSLVLVTAFLFLLPNCTVSAENTEKTSEIYVEGRSFMFDGEELSLHGVNITELSWSTYGDGNTAEGESDAHHSFELATETWNCNFLRIAVNPEYYVNGGVHKGVERTAEEFRALVDEFVTGATSRGIFVILDCHGYYGVTDLILDFWRIAAKKYDDNGRVIYGLLNEPTGDWKTYYEGGTLTENNETFKVYGMPVLVDLVRSISDNVALIGAIDYAYHLTYITRSDLAVLGESRSGATGLTADEYVQKYYLAREDRVGNGIAFDSHIYSTKPADWELYVGSVMKEFPLVIGEYGPSARQGVLSNLTDDEETYLERMFNFVKTNKLHTTAWGISAWPFLATSNGRVTPFGQAVSKFIAENTTKIELGYTGNLLANHIAEFKPIAQKLNSKEVAENQTFYNHAHKSGANIGDSVITYITDGNTEAQCDIFALYDHRMGIEFKLDNLLACNEIKISSGNQNSPDFYKVYASNSLDTLYDEKNLLENLSKAHNGTVTYAIDKQIRYIAFLAQGDNGGHIHIKELELYGKKIGDLDDNGKVNADDLNLFKKLLAGLQANNFSVSLTDTNADSNFDIRDLVRIKKQVG